MIRILAIMIAILIVCKSQNLNFFQNEYDVKMEIAKVAEINNTYVKNLKVDFVPYNRTTRVFNATNQLRVNIEMHTMLHIQVYKLMSNEYRFFPVTVKVNACAEYQKNTFAAKGILLKTSNWNPCDVKKNVMYHIYNAIPDFSKFPPHLPRGSYKMVTTFTDQSYLIFTLEFFGKIIDKPIDWKKIPERNWN